VHLPSDLDEYLLSGRQLSYDVENCICGKLRTNDKQKLMSENIEVALIDAHYPSRKQLESGPWGHYIIPSVSLTAECDDFEPAHILLWLPNEELYGTYDPHHSWLGIFPNTRWSDIEENPLPFINAQWQDHQRKLAIPFDPRGRYDIIYEQ
jgi:hypothetical protein